MTSHSIHAPLVHALSLLYPLFILHSSIPSSIPSSISSPYHTLSSFLSSSASLAPITTLVTTRSFCTCPFTMPSESEKASGFHDHDNQFSHTRASSGDTEDFTNDPRYGTLNQVHQKEEHDGDKRTSFASMRTSEHPILYYSEHSTIHHSKRKRPELDESDGSRSPRAQRQRVNGVSDPETTPMTNRRAKRKDWSSSGPTIRSISVLATSTPLHQRVGRLHFGYCTSWPRGELLQAFPR